MKIISLSTLVFIKNITLEMNQPLPAFLAAYTESENDPPIKFRGKEERELQNHINSILTYPKCKECHKPICGSNNDCGCPENAIFRKEYAYVDQEIKKTGEAIKNLAKYAFKPLRNSYGSGATIFGGVIGIVNLIAMVVSIPIILFSSICLAVAIPAIATFNYVARRGLNEEKQSINDGYANAFNHAIRLHHQHIKSVKKRHEEKILSEISFKPPMKKPDVEKRGIMGNPFAHFVGSAFAAFGIFSLLFLKVGLVVAGLSTNPIGWAIAAAIVIGVGCYFAYNRYQFLTNKIVYDRQSKMLEHTFNTVKDYVSEFEKKILQNRVEENETENRKLRNRVQELESRYEPKLSRIYDPKPRLSPRLSIEGRSIEEQVSYSPMEPNLLFFPKPKSRHSNNKEEEKVLRFNHKLTYSNSDSQ